LHLLFRVILVANTNTVVEIAFGCSVAYYIACYNAI